MPWPREGSPDPVVSRESRDQSCRLSGRFSCVKGGAVKKGFLKEVVHRPLVRGLLLLMTGWLVGCGSENREVASASPAAEVKGEPIRGEPIAAPAVPGSQVTNDSPDLAATGALVSEDLSASGKVPSVAETNSPASALSSGGGASASETAGTPEAPLTVGFDRLSSFKYDLPEGPVDTNALAQATGTNQIPESIRALNNQFVALKGYMLPLKVEKGLVTEMLILRDQSMCCYGAVPRINEWVSVKMVSAGAKPVMDQAVTLFGRLKVGEMYENGYLVGIYAVDGDRIAGPLDM